MLDTQLSRRAFLKGGGALVVTFTLAPPSVEAQQTFPPGMTRPYARSSLLDEPVARRP